MGPLKTRIAKAILRKNKAGSTTLPNFKPHYKALVSKQCGTGKKETQTNGTESRPRKKIPLIYVTMLFNWETLISSKKCCWENWITTCKRMKLDPYLAHKTNIRTETIKFPEENTGENSLTLFLAMIFFFFRTDTKSTSKKSKNQ